MLSIWRKCLGFSDEYIKYIDQYVFKKDNERILDTLLEAFAFAFRENHTLSDKKLVEYFYGFIALGITKDRWEEITSLFDSLIDVSTKYETYSGETKVKNQQEFRDMLSKNNFFKAIFTKIIKYIENKEIEGLEAFEKKQLLKKLKDFLPPKKSNQTVKSKVLNLD